MKTFAFRKKLENAGLGVVWLFVVLKNIMMGYSKGERERHFCVLKCYWLVQFIILILGLFVYLFSFSFEEKLNFLFWEFTHRIIKKHAFS